MFWLAHEMTSLTIPLREKVQYTITILHCADQSAGIDPAGLGIESLARQTSYVSDAITTEKLNLLSSVNRTLFQLAEVQ